MHLRNGPILQPLEITQRRGPLLWQPAAARPHSAQGLAPRNPAPAPQGWPKHGQDPEGVPAPPTASATDRWETHGLSSLGQGEGEVSHHRWWGKGEGLSRPPAGQAGAEEDGGGSPDSGWSGAGLGRCCHGDGRRLPAASERPVTGPAHREDSGAVGGSQLAGVPLRLPPAPEPGVGPEQR